ncbi:MAG: DUF4338 domain-containing protein [Dehalococcoidia bacterium]|nr:DUF4338 domain-containing protein [Dehalococcoidia bacterium]
MPTLNEQGAHAANRLRSRVMHSLQEQGFQIQKELLVPPDNGDKDKLRTLHREAVKHNVARSRPGLERHENRLLTSIASGTDIIPERIRPRLVQVQPGSDDELLFRYVRLHWSIPVSAGYGRRLRFMVFDESNGKLIGIFGLGDPIFSLGPRDRWIGWDSDTRRKRLQCVMDLFVLGAVPPYSYLLCGKLVAMLATSHVVHEAFRRKYGGRLSYINRKPLDGRLALLTTTSALGRSSLYNRLRYEEHEVFQSVGFTRGSGEFHFSNGFYDDLRQFALEHCDATAKHPLWGNGFRNRRELVRKTLPLLGLPRELLYHGIEREIFVVPLAANTRNFLSGEDQGLHLHRRTVNGLFEWFRDRWLLPRAARDSRFLDFDRETYRLWRSE